MSFTRTMGRSDHELDGMLVLSPGERGLTAKVLLLHEEFVIETADGERETWARNVISANPYDTRTMQLELGNATLFFFFFEADEPLVFAEHLAEYVETPRKRRKRQSRISESPDRSATQGSEPAGPNADTPDRDASPQRTRFGRIKHEHAWTSNGIGGGITRSVCDSCGQITIDLTGTYELTADVSALLTLRR